MKRVSIDEPVKETALPFLSFSRISKYERCPRQYQLYYVDRLRPRVQPATLVFGQVIHQVLARLFEEGKEPTEAFEKAWRAMEGADLRFGARDSWERLLAIGTDLLDLFVQHELMKLTEVTACEKDFAFDVTSLETPFIGVIDLVANFRGQKTVVDFKTSASSYRKQDVVLSDQLTAYQLAVPDAEQIALCVLVKTKRPKIEWHTATRSGEELSEFLEKAGAVAQDIQAARFFKRPGMHCAWCEYLPVCMGDERKAAETLVYVSSSK